MAEGDAAGTTTQDPPAPSPQELLAWDVEKQGEIPEQYRTLSLDDVRSLITEQTSAREREMLDRMRAEQERSRQLAQASAGERDDVAFYQQLREKLSSPDDTTRAEAAREQLDNEERYNRGALALQRGSRENMQREVLRDFWSQIHAELTSAGLSDVMPAIGDPGWTSMNEKLAAYDGKGGIAAYLIDYGKGVARAEAQVTQERQSRIEGNAQGAPNLPGGSAPAREDYANPDWVRAQMQGNPEWAFAISPDGKLTNLQRARRGGAVAAVAGMASKRS